MLSHQIMHTEEQTKAQGKLLAQLFDLPNDSNIAQDWSIESSGNGGMLKIELVRYIDIDTVNALVNGRDTSTL